METKIDTPLFENLRKLINVIDELRDVGLQEYINLPRIAVLGQQSAGKSSLLESIVGLDFLPRGDGVVTRRPLELRLIHVNTDDESFRPYAEFQSLKGQKFTDFDKVRQTIEDLTDKECGKNKGIVNVPILLSVYSPACPDLTIIDLPGITRIPLNGSDQKQNIEEVTKNMALHYVKDERTIILCVVPANADISTSDGLQMARQVDPKGTRTIGVITKIDIMDRGTNAKKMILGQEIELKLGYVGVKNRSQADIISKQKVKEALQLEREYFSKHPIYSTMPANLLGAEALTKKLSTVMFHHIRTFLPKIISEINQKIKECEERLKDLGPSLPRDAKEKMHLLWNILTDFAENYKNQIKGKYDSKRKISVKQEISGGALIKQMFSNLYKKEADKNYKATSCYSDKDIDRAIILHQGDSIPGFPSIDSFLYLITPQLEKLKEPALDLLHDVFVYLESMAQAICEKLFARFPSIIEEISEIAIQVIAAEKEKTREIVENLIDSELSYLFTNDESYLLARTSVAPQQNNNNQQQNQQQQQQQQQQQYLDPTKILILELKARIDSYYSIVVRNIRDSIPKTIGHFLVQKSQDSMQYQLYNEIMKNEAVLDLLGESPHITQERDTLNGILDVLRKAQKVLKKDPNLALYSKFEENEYDDNSLNNNKNEQIQQQTQQHQQNTMQNSTFNSQQTKPQFAPQQKKAEIPNNSLFG